MAKRATWSGFSAAFCWLMVSLAVTICAAPIGTGHGGSQAGPSSQAPGASTQYSLAAAGSLGHELSQLLTLPIASIDQKAVEYGQPVCHIDMHRGKLNAAWISGASGPDNVWTPAFKALEEALMALQLDRPAAISRPTSLPEGPYHITPFQRRAVKLPPDNLPSIAVTWAISPVDGIAIRGPGPLATVQHGLGQRLFAGPNRAGKVITADRRPVADAVWSDAALLTSAWVGETTGSGQNRRQWKTWTDFYDNDMSLKRRELRWIVDASVTDEKTRFIIHAIARGHPDTQSHIPKWPGVRFNARSGSFCFLLGTPSGEWVTQTLYLFNNNLHTQTGLGRKLIKSVTLFSVVNERGESSDSLAWELVPYSNEDAKQLQEAGCQTPPDITGQQPADSQVQHVRLTKRMDPVTGQLGMDAMDIMEWSIAKGQGLSQLLLAPLDQVDHMATSLHQPVCHLTPHRRYLVPLWEMTPGAAFESNRLLEALKEALSSLQRPRLRESETRVLPEGPYQASTFKRKATPDPVQLTELSLTWMVNPVDGIAIRASGKLADITPGMGQQLYSALRTTRFRSIEAPPDSFWSDAAILTTVWNSATLTGGGTQLRNQYRKWAAKDSGSIAFTIKLRKSLSWILDASIVDQMTLKIIETLAMAISESPNKVPGWPGVRYEPGTGSFDQLLGSPSGRWVVQSLYLFDNNDGTEAMGWKLLKSVRLFSITNDQGDSSNCLAWEVVPYSAELAAKIHATIIGGGETQGRLPQA